MTDETCTLHATTVAVDDRAVLIVGPSGSGKSALAIQLLALGAMLVSDDRTHLARQGHALIASAPHAIAGLIEARGVGILQTRTAGPTPVVFAVDLACTEAKRLPDLHHMSLLDIALPCLHNCASPHFPAAILLYLRGKRTEPT